MARRTTPHSTPHDAAASSYGPKTALAWREEGERRRGLEPDSTCVTDLSIWSAERSKQVGETHIHTTMLIHLIQRCSYSHVVDISNRLNVDVECTCGASRLSHLDHRIMSAHSLRHDSLPVSSSLTSHTAFYQTMGKNSHVVDHINTSGSPGQRLRRQQGVAEHPWSPLKRTRRGCE